MKFLILCIFISKLFASDYIVDYKFNSDKNWKDFSQSEELSIKNLITHLEKSSTGAKLLAKARIKAFSYGMNLYEAIRSGTTSLTDTTMTRKFHPDHPEDVVFKTKSLVFLNKDLNQFDALMDLAHELTHFVYRRDFNPYQVNFTLREFIKNTIEAQGGEVHAFLTECNVLRDLFPTLVSRNKNCTKIYDSKTKSFSTDLAVKKFYSLGNLKSQFDTLMKMSGNSQLESVSSEDISFISSAYGIPYPIAAFKEYRSVMNKVCSNDQKRLAIMSQRYEGRGPASVQRLEGFVQNYRKRCSSFQ